MLKNAHMGRGGAYRSEQFSYEHGMCVFIGSIDSYDIGSIDTYNIGIETLEHGVVSVHTPGEASISRYTETYCNWNIYTI